MLQSRSSNRSRRRNRSEQRRRRQDHIRSAERSRRLHIQSLEKRELLAGDIELITVSPNFGSFITDGSVLTDRPRELTLQFTPGTNLDASTLGAVQIVGSGFDDTFGNGNDITVMPGFRGLGDTPDQVVFRFAESLPDDLYQITVIGSGATPLADVAGENFGGAQSEELTVGVTGSPTGGDFTLDLSINGGAPETTNPIPFDAGPNRLRFGLLSLPSVNFGDVMVTGTGTIDSGNLTVTFAGNLANTDLSVALNANNLTGGTNPDVALTVIDEGLGADRTIEFDLDLGANVQGVVPQPVLRDQIITITDNAGATLLVDGDTITIDDDDVAGGLVFEFNMTDVDANFSADVAVDILSTDDANTVTAALEQAINNATFAGPGVTATATGADVELTGRAFDPIVSVNTVDGGAVTTDLGDLSQARDTVIVYFNQDDLSQAVAEDLKYYRLIDTARTLDESDDAITFPESVIYDADHDRAVLTFENDIPVGTFRLQVGTSDESNGSTDEAVNVGRLIGTAGYVESAFIGDEDGNDDVDLYRVDLASGANLDVMITPAIDLDAVVRIFDVDGNPLSPPVLVDGGAAGVPEAFTFVVPSDGTYYIGVSSEGNETYDASDGSLNTGGTTSGGYRIELDVDTLISTIDDNSSFATATSLGTIGAQGQSFSSQIQSQSIPLPLYPGGSDEPGHREIPAESHGAGAGAGLSIPGAIGTVQYYFPDQYGTNPQGLPLFNQITPNQKERAHEIFELYASLYGFEVRQTPSSGIPIITGDIRAFEPTYPVGISLSSVLISGAANYGSSPYGGSWFNVALHEIGHAIGITHSYDLPSIQGGNGVAEDQFPGNHDIVHGRRINRPDATDIDLYRFDVPAAGTIQAEIIAERLATSSLLDSALRLYRQEADGSRTLVAQNDDYFSDDAFIEIPVDAAGTYFVGVTSTGNTDYDPVISDTGFGGLTDGNYRLKLNFSDAAKSSIVDQTGKRFDGDGDGKEGGAFVFGFRSDNTLLVDKTAVTNLTQPISSGQAVLRVKDVTVFPDTTGFDIQIDNETMTVTAIDVATNRLTVTRTTPTALHVLNSTVRPVSANGSEANPFGRIQDAVAAAGPDDIIRIVANGGADNDISTIADNRPYVVGLSDSFSALEDGSKLEIPKDVVLQIDPGAIIKLQRANINAGSTAQGVDRDGGAVQVLGTPDSNVILTAYGNDAIGGDSDGVTDGANPGDWGGIVFREDSDFVATDETTNVDDLPITLNYVNQADISFGGGLVSVNGAETPYTPLHLVDSRPTISYNTIHDNSQGAISADPDSFSDSRRRIGPDISGNLLSANTTNGLVIRFDSSATGATAALLTKTARFDDTDIVHVFTDNLEIAGSAGGPINPANPSQVLPSGRLAIDPGVVVKLSSARIEGGRGASNFIAEGTPENPVIFTSLLDDRYGGGGTFDTTGNGSTALPSPGDWSGLVFNMVSTASIDNALISYAGGESPIAGGLSSFNTVEAHHGANVRIANSTLQFNADGNASDNRDARGTNRAATIFVRQAQPIIVNNIFTDNAGTLIDINANAMLSVVQRDRGRSTGPLDVGVSDERPTLNPGIDFADNHGPLIRLNRFENNDVNGMAVRGGQLSTESVWDDTDIVHVVTDEIIVDHHHTFSGLRLQSAPDESLVIKLSGGNAGFTADGVLLDIDDRIGGTVEVLGRPGFPVVMTSLDDCSVGAGLTPDGFPQLFTNLLCTPAETVSADVIDIVLALDDTSSFQNSGNTLIAEFPNIVASLQAALPGADFAFSIVRFEEYEGTGFAAGTRPFILNQPLIATTTTDFQLAIDSALARVSPPGGSVADDETYIEALFQIATGAGFDGNADGDVSDSGAAGLVTTQISPGAGGDVPDFASFMPDPTGPVLTADGTIGGVGFRSNATERIVLLGTDGNLNVEDDGLTTYTSVHGTVPVSDFNLTTGGSVGTPGGLGATIQNTVDQLILNNIKVIGLGGIGFTDVQTPLTALATLTGATDTSGNPLYFDIDPNNGGEIAQAIVDAVTGVIPGLQGTAGDWRSLQFNENANDRNVRTVLENEKANNSGSETNDNPGNAQNLGELAKDLKSGDENRALGFEVHGFISTDDPGDVDVYSFSVDAGTEVWIDLDRTRGASLNSKVELIRQDGTVVALATGNSLGSISSPDGSLSIPSQLGPMLLNSFDGGDFYSLNYQDAGMRVVLPGNVGGTNETFYVRVTSEGLNPGENGLTNGEYQLQVRLRQTDEKPGSIVQYADIRFATNGIEVFGLPSHSPLMGETDEDSTGNDSAGGAQRLGNQLESDRNTISISADLSSGGDIDFYRFNSDYASTIFGPSIQAIGAVNGGPKTWSTVIDLDYADGLTRADSNLVVFQYDPANPDVAIPVLIGRESNVSDDQPGAGQGIDLDDLTRGSAGQLDPFIGPVQLPTGTPGSQTEYLVSVSSNTQLLTQLNQTYISSANNPLARLEPVNSVTRITEDHIGFQGYDSNGSQVDPRYSLFDISNTTSLAPNVRAFDLSDVPLFVSVNDTNTSNVNLQTINPLFGQLTTDIASLSDLTDFQTQDIVMRSDGTLWAYQRIDGYSSSSRADNGTAGRLVQLDPGTGAVIGTALNDNVLGRTPTPDVNNSNNTNPSFAEITFSDDVDALAWERSGGVGSAAQYALYYSVREDGVDGSGASSNNSKLYRANPDTGSVAKNANSQYGVRGDLQPTGVTFAGANMTVSDGTAPSARVRIEARAPGAAGNGITVNVTRGDFTNAVTVSVAGNNINLSIDDTPNANAGAIIDAINQHAQARRLVTAGLTSGTRGEGGTAVSATTVLAGGVGTPLQGNVTGLSFGQFHGDSNLLSNSARLYGVTDAGEFITINTSSGRVTNIVDLTGTGITGFQGLSLGPQNLHGGLFQNTVFAITTSGQLMAINAATGTPVSAFGSDNETQQLSVSGAPNAGDSFTLTFNDDYYGSITTGPIVFSPGGTLSASAVRSALLGLTSPGGISLFQSADLNVTGGALPGTPIQIEFRGFYQDKPVNALSVNNALMTGGSVSRSTTAQGGDGTRDQILLSTAATNNPTGLAFSPLDLNLWHPTTTRMGVDGSTGGGDGLIDSDPLDSDPGHGINPAFDLSRTPSDVDVDHFDPRGHEYTLNQLQGGISLYFGLENYVNSNNQPYLNYESNRTQLGAQFNDYQRDLTSPATVGDNYNLPGGSFGTMLTDPFDLTSLTGDSADKGDRPTLYFNYFLDSEDRNTSDANSTARDTARVYISNNGGRNWQLLATNNTPFAANGQSGAEDATTEVPDFVSHLRSADQSNSKQQVQPLFDDTDSWRQARVDLSDYKGQSGLRLRFDFSTAGTIVDTVSDSSDTFGTGANTTNDSDLQTPQDEYGNLNDDRRGQNNTGEGFYIDDIIIGWAERGEMITGATTESGSFGVPQDPDPLAPVQSLVGPYQVEIRRGHEYGVIIDPIKPDIAVASTFDPNTQFIPGYDFGLPTLTDDFESGDFSGLGWRPADADSPWTVEDNFAVFGPPHTFEAQSGSLNTNQRSDLTVSVTTGAGTLEFDQFFTPDPLGNDRFQVLVDNTGDGGAAYEVTVGDTGSFTHVTIPIDAGVHTFNFVYRKDSTGTDGVGSVLIDNVVFPSASGGFIRGDRNLVREQGHFQIQGNTIRDSSDDAIHIEAGPRDPLTNFTHPGSPIQFETVNSDRLVPGVTVVNNVIARFGSDGISLGGESNANANVPEAAVPFAKILHNTIYGGSTPDPGSGTVVGVRVENDATATLLNNVIVNTGTGVDVDASSLSTVVARTYFRGNTQDVSLGVTNSLAIPDNPANLLFVDEATDNFYLAGDSDPLDGIFDGALPIDRSLSKLDDRTNYVAVKADLGIPASNIISPKLDLFGQTRVDDSLQPPSGVGSEVFSDVGAIERGDFTGPIATLVAPLDNGPEDLNPLLHDTFIVVPDFLTRLVVQLSDSGIGIDDSNVEAAQWELRRNGVAFTEGVDYAFIYNPAFDQVIFQSLTVFASDNQYTIVVIDPSAADGMRDLAGNLIQANRPNDEIRFEIVMDNGGNTLPVNSAPLTDTTPEDTALVFGTSSGNAITVSDPDAGLGTNELTVTLAAEHGTAVPVTVLGVTESLLMTLPVTQADQILVGDGTAMIGQSVAVGDAFFSFVDSVIVSMPGPAEVAVAGSDDATAVATALAMVLNHPTNFGALTASASPGVVTLTGVTASNPSDPAIVLDGATVTTLDGAMVMGRHISVGDARQGFGPYGMVFTYVDAATVLTPDAKEIPVNASDLDSDVASATASVLRSFFGPGTATAMPASNVVTLSGVNTEDSLITLSGDIDLLNQALDGLQFVPDANYFGPASLTILTEDNGQFTVNTPENGQDEDTVLIQVTAVNDQPAFDMIIDQTRPEDTVSLTVAIAGITAGPQTGLPPNETEQVRFTATSSDTSIVPNPSISYTFFNTTASLVAAPIGNENGTVTITVTIEDPGPDNVFDDVPGTLLVDESADNLSFARSFLITVDAVNDPPAGTDATKTILEDSSYTFTASDFGFSDLIDGNSLSAVTITTLPAGSEGTLLLSGVSLTTPGLSIAVSEIPNLVFKPADDLNGLNEGTFTFQVQDDGGKANGGEDLDQSANTFDFNITPVNDDPNNDMGSLPTDIPVIEDVDSDVDLWAMHFDDVDAFSNQLKVTLSTSTGGELSGALGTGITLGGSTTALEISGTLSALNTYFDSAGNITYKHSTTHLNGPDVDTIQVEINDNGNGPIGSGGGTDQDLGTVNVDITPVNDPPAGGDVTKTIQEDTSRTFAEVDFGFSDPTDNNAHSLFAVKITTLPPATEGELRLFGVPLTTPGLSIARAEIPSLVFKPADDLYGVNKGTFTFQVQDNGLKAKGGEDLDQSANTFTFDITPVNDDPNNDMGSLPTDIPVIEDVDSDVDLSAMHFDDVDSFSNQLKVTLSTSTGGELSGALGTGITLGGSTTALEISGTLSDLNTYFDTAGNITYKHSTTHLKGDDADTIQVEINDNGHGPTGSGGGTDQDLGTVNVDISPTNDDPTNANAANFLTDITVIEDIASDVDLSAIDVSDVDSDDSVPGDLTITLTTGSGGTLAAVDDGGVTVGGSGTGVLTLTGTQAELNTFLNDTTKIEFTSFLNANGNADTIQVEINDNGNTGSGGGTDVELGRVNVDISAVNDDPTNANAANFPTDITVLEDIASDVDLSLIDLLDVDSGTGDLTITLTTGLGGTLAANTGGEVTVGGGGTGVLTLTGTQTELNTFVNDATKIQFTSALNANGDDADTIQVDVTDNGNTGTGGGGRIDFRTVNVDIQRVTSVPVDDGPFTTDEDKSLQIDDSELLANDYDLNIGPPTPGSQWIQSVQSMSSSGATVTFDTTTGKITYDPSTSTKIQALKPGQLLDPPDTFTYSITDDISQVNPNIATVRLIVKGINDAPTVVDDFVTESTTPDPVVIIRPLENDVDVDGTIDLDSIVITQDPMFGAIAKQINSQGILELAYSPFATFTGGDQFRYSISDNLGQSSLQATVTIEPSLAPRTVPDAKTRLQNDNVNVDVLTNDAVVPGQGTFDLATLMIASGPSNGQAIPQTDGTVTYTPNLDFVGMDSFQYTIADTSGNVSAPTSVSVTIEARVPPVTDPDVATGREGDSQNIDVLSNDVAVQGQLDPATLTIVGDPSSGQATPHADGTITYLPNAGFVGMDSFQYSVADTEDNVSAATLVSVTIEALTPPPTDPDVAGSVAGDNAIVDVLSNDTPVSGQFDFSTLTIVSGPSNGQATPQLDGTIIYDPNQGFFGTDSFEYTVADTGGNVSDPTTATVRVVESGLENPLLPVDVNADGKVTLLDALLVINRLARSGQPQVPVLPDDRGPDFFDVDGGLFISTLDALLVINHVGREQASPGSGELVGQPIIADIASTVNRDTQSPSVDAVFDAVGAVSSDAQKLVDVGTGNRVEVGLVNLLAEDRDSDEKDESEESVATLNDLAILDLL